MSDNVLVAKIWISLVAIAFSSLGSWSVVVYLTTGLGTFLGTLGAMVIACFIGFIMLKLVQFSALCWVTICKQRGR